MLFKASSKVLNRCFSSNPLFSVANRFPFSAADLSSTASNLSLDKEKDLALSAYLLIRYFKISGHEIADLDPLKLQNVAEYGKHYVKQRLDAILAKNKVIKDQDLDVPFNFPHSPMIDNNIAHFLKERPTWTLRQIKNRLHSIYSNKIGLEFMHVSCYEQKAWLMEEMEKISNTDFSKAYKLNIYNQLAKVEAFNYFLNDKLKTSKRFGIEGLDCAIAGLNHLVETAADMGVDYIGMGMAHRGRLSCLANVFQKPMVKIFSEFQQNLDNEAWGNSGDVKYHLGTSSQRKINGKNMRLSILPNPSHLQTVGALVMGHVKAVQDSLNNGNKALSVILHGDAAVAGQNIVYECLQMDYLPHYGGHGTIHVIQNNQIGFTTTPAQHRTGFYCTEVAKSIQAPIIHVNADQPEYVFKAVELALAYRQKYRKDVFLDIIGYRRYGHTEQDQPFFTQPIMYTKIAQKKNIYTLYTERMISEGVITDQEAKATWDSEIDKLKEAYVKSLSQTFDTDKWKSKSYHKMITLSDLGQIMRTGVTKDSLQQVGKSITDIPENFSIHPSIKKIYDQRRQSIETGQGIDYGTAEALAFGTLLNEGFNIRLSGQDVQRGTFSHRHAVLIDQKTQQKYMPLRNLVAKGEQSRVQIQNSLLSEYAALGFEYGYTITRPTTLTIWEAQFGDFANAAQIVTDNYIISGQAKWNQECGLVLNLPHGMDGQGPEHSSCRIERYLQLADDGWATLTRDQIISQDYNPLRNVNIQVVCPSTAGNLFHAYRRQLRRDYRKPLINVMNKKLLKFREATSNIQFLNNSRFVTILAELDKQINPKNVKKVVITYGQAYYSALEKRTELGRKDVGFIRVEQLAPFNYMRFKNLIEMYPNAEQIVWFQQQHRNAGPWIYLAPRLSFVMDWSKSQGRIKTSSLDLISRKPSASPAVGKKKKHDQEQAQLLKQLFN